MNNTNNVHCRLCAQLKPLNQLTNLQTDVETCHKVVNKLSRFNIVMDLEENILPKTVCLICVKSLEKAFTFIMAVEQAQALLSDYILVQISAVKTDSLDTNDVPADDNVVIDIKPEIQRDPMDLSDDDDLNAGAEEFDDQSTGKDIDEPKETKINIKFEINDDSDSNNVEDNKNIKVDKSFDTNSGQNENLNARENEFTVIDATFPEYKNIITIDGQEKEIDSEMITPLENDLYSADDLNDLNNTMDYGTTDTDVMSTVAHSKELLTSPQAHKVFDTTEYPEEYLTKQISRLGALPKSLLQCLKTTWLDYEWKCSGCGTVFSNIEELQTHSQQYHNACNSYQCTDCKIKKQRLNAFIKHVRSHRKYLHYSCYKCFEKFPRMQDTLQHIRTVHQNSKFVCLGCNSTFSNNSELDEHVNKLYKILWKQKLFISKDNLTCDTCNKVCVSIAALRTHLNNHKEKTRDHLCDRCGKCFDSNPSLRSHMEIHTDRETFTCEICKTTFKNVYTLRYHSTIHSGLKPFACDICNKRFRNRPQIRNHMKHHSDYLPVTCTVCGKRFRTELRLQNHMLQHTGEKPFSCNICPRDFTNLSNRNKHMRRKHGIEMAKKRQPIIKLQNDDLAPSDLAPGEAISADLDKMNDWKKVMESRNGNKGMNRAKKPKEQSKECNEN